VIWLALAVGLAAISAAGVAYVGRRGRRRALLLSPDLAARLAAALDAYQRADPWQPAAAPEAPPGAAAIEAALIEREPHRALEIAEAALAAGTEVAAAARIWLAWALCANGQPRAALDQIAKAAGSSGTAGSGSSGATGASSGSSGASPAGPLATYVRARADYLNFEHNHGATGAVPPLVTTGDLAVVTLARGRGSAAWLAGATDVQLSAAQVTAAIAEHRETTARCLAHVLDALEAAPGFTDAAYLAARLAVKAGLLAEGRRLFDAVAPRIAGRPDADAFDRDRKDLADPSGAVAAARQPPPAQGKRSRGLRVLK